MALRTWKGTSVQEGGPSCACGGADEVEVVGVVEGEEEGEEVELEAGGEVVVAVVQ